MYRQKIFVSSRVVSFCLIYAFFQIVSLIRGRFATCALVLSNMERAFCSSTSLLFSSCCTMSVFWVRFDICPFKFDFWYNWFSANIPKTQIISLQSYYNHISFMSFSRMQLDIWKIYRFRWYLSSISIFDVIRCWFQQISIIDVEFTFDVDSIY